MRHVPVLLKETIELLNLSPGKNAVDCTLGDGGHAEAILAVTTPNGRLLGIDADPESLLRAKQNLYSFQDRVIYSRSNFAELKKIIFENTFSPVDAIVMDLGWSSPQFAERGRGFSFDKDETLNMRFDGSSAGPSALNIINEYSETELDKIFRHYGEEKFHQEIAEAIVRARFNQKIETTRELAEIILAVYREKLKTDKEIPRIGGIHPATKVFQALRIETNRELEVLKEVLPQALEILAVGGRLAVITFHSLEDRIVKQYFKSQENKTLKLINRKPAIAGGEELNINPRARSAKLRVIEKI